MRNDIFEEVKQEGIALERKKASSIFEGLSPLSPMETINLLNK